MHPGQSLCSRLYKSAYKLVMHGSYRLKLICIGMWS